MRTLLIVTALALAPVGASAMSHGDKADIVDTAVKAGQFNTLATALKAAGLVDTLKGPGPFTVFAPTDAAFAKLPPGVLDQLTKPENKAQLASILTFHVVPGKRTSGEVKGMRADVTTVNGAPLAVDGTSGLKVGDATVTTADIMASNGVIHVIDTVLIPPRQ
jgi:uncharacterized surface protein with fasciclin (FAS1) repeats